MHREQRQRVQELLTSKGIERALFANFNSVKWLTGFAMPVQLGPNFFAGGPPAVWYEAGHFTLFVVDSFAAEAAPFDREPDGTVVSYLGYIIEQPIAGAKHLAAALRQVIGKSGVKSGVVGLEVADVTSMVSTLLQNELLSPGGQFTPIDGWLEPLRMVKTEEELIKLKENFALTDLGHATARQTIAVGKREIDIWTAVHEAVQQAAGRRVPLGNDCVVSRRQANIGGWPLDYKLEANDSLILDLSTVLHGYWSDSCAVYYASDPTPRQRAIHKTVSNALDFAISLIKPGVIAKEVDRKVRQFITDSGYSVYPHHTGHGVGVSGHEAPRIVPYNEEVLQEGMVIMLEPGVYIPGQISIRLEDAMLITADGVEILTKHDKSLP